MAHAPLCVDEIEGRPIVVAEAAPDRIVVVDRDRIRQLHHLHGTTNVVGVVLERELGRVHADDDEPLIPVFLGPGAHIGNRAQPVDAGVSPEIDEHDLAAQARGGQRLGVEPRGGATQRTQLAFDGRTNRGRRQLLHECRKQAAGNSERGDAHRGSAQEPTPTLVDSVGTLSRAHREISPTGRGAARLCVAVTLAQERRNSPLWAVRGR
jgi:hypothetical protein